MKGFSGISTCFTLLLSLAIGSANASLVCPTVAQLQNYQPELSDLIPVFGNSRFNPATQKIILTVPMFGEFEPNHLFFIKINNVEIQKGEFDTNINDRLNNIIAQLQPQSDLQPFAHYNSEDGKPVILCAYSGPGTLNAVAFVTEKPANAPQLMEEKANNKAINTKTMLSLFSNEMKQ